MFNQIPLKRLMLYVFLLGLLPPLVTIGYFISKKSSLDSLRTHIHLVQEIGMKRERKQAVNLAVLNNFRESDHFYIDKHLENLIFLQSEIEGLQKAMQNKNFRDDENIKKRLDFLTSSNNLVFTEGIVQSTPEFQEVIESLVHPVEVNAEDLKIVLARIEGSEIGKDSPGPNRPQLIIVDFKIEKKSITEKNQVFVLNLKLLKREFL